MAVSYLASPLKLLVRTGGPETGPSLGQTSDPRKERVGMRILVTNDDGFDAPGLAVLARAFAEAGHEVLVVAPLVEASGSGAGIGPLRAMGGGIHVEAVAPTWPRGDQGPRSGRAPGTDRDHGLPRCVRTASGPRRLGHQPWSQRGTGGVALGHGRARLSPLSISA